MNQPSSNIPRLIEQARTGDAHSLGRLFEHYRPWLRMMAQRTLPLDMQKRADGLVNQTRNADLEEEAVVRGAEHLSRTR